MDINERMATELMGWARTEYGKYAGNYWRDAEGKVLSISWHPDTDISQALMCAEKLNPYQVEIIYPENKIGTYLTRIFSNTKGGQMYQGAGDTKELAVCSAILEALEVDNEHK